MTLPFFQVSLVVDSVTSGNLCFPEKKVHCMAYHTKLYCVCCLPPSSVSITFRTLFRYSFELGETDPELAVKSGICDLTMIPVDTSVDPLKVSEPVSKV